MLSTTVEITIGYLTAGYKIWWFTIYNSRNYYRLLNQGCYLFAMVSTTVEITIGYLTVIALISPAYLQQ